MTDAFLRDHGGSSKLITPANLSRLDSREELADIESLDLSTSIREYQSQAMSLRWVFRSTSTPLPFSIESQENDDDKATPNLKRSVRTTRVLFSRGRVCSIAPKLLSSLSPPTGPDSPVSGGLRSVTRSTHGSRRWM